MKKLLLLVAVTLAFSLTALAQGTGTSGSQSTGTSGTQGTESSTTTTKAKKSKKSAGEAGEMGATSGKEHQVTGCLAKNAEGSGFILTNGRYKKGVEVKSSEDMSAHVGHEVKLTGTWEKPTAGGEGGAGAKGKEMRVFNATNLQHISDTCTAGAAKGGKMKKEKSSTKSTTPGY